MGLITLINKKINNLTSKPTKKNYDIYFLSLTAFSLI